MLLNAAFSAASGATLAAANSWWSDQLANPGTTVTATVGVALVGYAVLLAWASGRGITAQAGRIVAALDACSMLGTLAVLSLLGSGFTPAGLPERHCPDSLSAPSDGSSGMQPAVMFAAEHAGAISALALPTTAQAVAGVLAGFGIGVIAAIMGVAGGELLIPTIVLLYEVDPKLAGSLSLLVSLPTMVMAFFRYSRDQAFAVLGLHPWFVAAMAGGSVAGAFLGALLLGLVSEAVLVPIIVALLLFSAVKVWSHGT